MGGGGVTVSSMTVHNGRLLVRYSEERARIKECKSNQTREIYGQSKVFGIRRVEK